MDANINRLFLVIVMIVLSLGNATARPFRLCVEAKKCGLMDTKGYWLIDPEYKNIFLPDKNGVAIYVDNNEQYGFLNTITKTTIIRSQYDLLLPFSENGLAPARRNGKHGYIDKAGTVVIPFKYNYTFPFSNNGLACVRNADGKYGYVNRAGSEVIPLEFDFSGGFSANGLTAVKRNKRFGYINASGALVVPFQFDYAGGFAANGLAYVEMNGKYGYIDKTGSLIIPIQYDDASGFESNGLAVVKISGKEQFINSSGKAVTPAFDKAYSFSENGIATVKRNEVYGFIDSSGKFVMNGFVDTDNKGNDVYGLKPENGDWGIYDVLSKQKVASLYDNYNGVNNVVLNRDDKVVWPKDYAQQRSKLEARKNAENERNRQSRPQTGHGGIRDTYRFEDGDVDVKCNDGFSFTIRRMDWGGWWYNGRSYEAEYAAAGAVCQ